MLYINYVPQHINTFVLIFLTNVKPKCAFSLYSMYIYILGQHIRMFFLEQEHVGFKLVKKKKSVQNYYESIKK